MTNEPHVSPEVQTETARLITQWEEGSVPYEEVMARFDVLAGEADAEHRFNDHGQIEFRRAIIEGRRGYYDDSIKHFERARDLFSAGGMRRRVVACHLNIGETYRLKGNFTRARQYFRISYEAALDLGHREMQVTARINEAQMLITLGYPDQAETTLLDCYAMASAPFPPDPDRDPHRKERARMFHMVNIAKSLTSIYANRGDVDLAWNYAREAHLIAYSLHATLLMGFADRAMGEALSLKPASIDPDINPDPDYHFAQSIQHLREVNAEAEIARTLYAHGRSLIGRGKRTQATRKLNQAITIFSQLGLTEEASRAAEEQLKLL
jgi:tetratricopeptide (TPR) repeat protein